PAALRELRGIHALRREHLSAHEVVETRAELQHLVGVVEVHDEALRCRSARCACSHPSSATGRVSRPVSVARRLDALPARARAATPCRIEASLKRLKAM